MAKTTTDWKKTFINASISALALAVTGRVADVLLNKGQDWWEARNKTDATPPAATPAPADPAPAPDAE